ncbi:hypothetical protein H3H37_04470 [Duganella sp. LX20W]|uniref:DUF3465 domain-containing protein n=1 Tax=Rugamonas brunnea TaxID=2758569 RepID=A0A7W2EPK9_9BURK|nr:hypothetical protein [Rugamonas brunnea]MBA5636302.1 hypothetical protein [Rugamonas brunnea]
MKNVLLAAGLLMITSAHSALADEAAACSAAAGSYRTGVVVRGPAFAHGQYRKGVELSHTHLTMKADQDGRIYDVAIDNVFVPGFDRNQAGIPAPLTAIRVNDRIGVCGQLYTNGVGIHWVHTNCGKRPTPAHPDGWLKELKPDGTAGPSVTDNGAFCPLFQRH